MHELEKSQKREQSFVINIFASIARRAVNGLGSATVCENGKFHLSEHARTKGYSDNWNVRICNFYTKCNAFHLMHSIISMNIIILGCQINEDSNN